MRASSAMSERERQHRDQRVAAEARDDLAAAVDEVDRSLFREAKRPRVRGMGRIVHALTLHVRVVRPTAGCCSTNSRLSVCAVPGAYSRRTIVRRATRREADVRRRMKRLGSLVALVVLRRTAQMADRFVAIRGRAGHRVKNTQVRSNAIPAVIPDTCTVYRDAGWSGAFG
jgi:hypothetical protein